MKLEKLGNITTNLDNKRIPLNSLQRELKSKKGLYPYIGANNIMGYINEYIFDEKILCLAEDGGSWGINQTCANIYNEKCWVNNHAHVLSENGKANLEYLRYFLNKADLNKYITGTTRGKLTKSALETILVPLPPLSTQLHIANILTKAENLISQRKESINLLDEFLKSTFLEMFGEIRINNKKFPTSQIGDKLDLITYGLTVRPEYIEVGIPLISAREIRSGNLNYESAPKISQLSFNLLSDKAKPKKYDILFSKTGSIGHCALVETNQVIAITQNAARLTFTNDINPIFALFYLRTPYFQHLANKTAKGNAVRDLQLGDFKKFNFIIPPMDLQTQFAQIVEKIQALKEQYQKSLKELENLYGSLSQRAFRGELSFKDEKLLMATEPGSVYKRKS
ncbi:MAG: restriction endonuclease subunit S [Bacteroidales bacterium]|nr:restriction endonuclease subunit S [Bacteroidales bacterium]